MIKTLKRIILSSLSILGISFVVWLVFLLNPNISYAHQTQFDNVTVYHNQALDEEVEVILSNAINIVKSSDIYDEDLNIQFCLNDDKYYPKLFPFAGATAYAFFNKTVMYASEPNFKENYTEFVWEVNDYEVRRYHLTHLLAHEFMHNYQHNFDAKYQITSTIGKINWKLEGHAEYISREYKNDGLLKDRVALHLQKVNEDHKGIPVLRLEDGTIQNLPYFKYSLVIQYLMEEKGLSYKQVCALDRSLDELYDEVIEWSEA